MAIKNIFGFIVLCFLQNAVLANPITYYFTGTVDVYNDYLGQPFDSSIVGTSVTGQYTFDPDTLSGTSQNLTTSSGASLSVDIGGVWLTVAAPLNINTDTMVISGSRSYGNRNDAFPELDNFTNYATGPFWRNAILDLDGSSDAGTQSFLPYDNINFDTSQFLFFASYDDWVMVDPSSGGESNFGGALYSIGVNLDSFSTINPVPVPAAVWLFGSGVLGLIALARRKTV